MSLKTSCIIHPKSHPFIRIMRWQTEACDGNTCAAALLAMFEAWHNWKIEQAFKAGKLNDISEFHGYGRSQDESLYQWHTEEELVKGILSIYGRVTVGKAIKLLIEKQFVSVHRNPDTRAKFDRTRFFLFEVAAVQIWINANYPSTIALDEPSANSGASSAKNGAPSARIESASAKNGALNAKNGGSYKESTETNKENRPKKHQQHAEAENVVVVDSNFSSVEGESDPLSQANLLREMHVIGVSPKVAAEFIGDSEISPETLRLQLDCLSDREPNDPPATFVSAVREKWSPPGDYHKRLEATANAKIARAANEQRQAAEARKQAAMDAESAIVGERITRLDSIWENLDSEDRALVEHEVFKINDGDLQTMDVIRQRVADGRGLPHIDRRQAIENLLEKQMLPLDIEQSASEPEVAPTAQPIAEAKPPEATNETWLDDAWEALDPDVREQIDEKINAIFHGAPPSAQNEAAKIAMRRAILRQTLAPALGKKSGAAAQTNAQNDQAQEKTG